MLDMKVQSRSSFSRCSLHRFDHEFKFVFRSLFVYFTDCYSRDTHCVQSRVYYSHLTIKHLIIKTIKTVVNEYEYMKQ